MVRVSVGSVSGSDNFWSGAAVPVWSPTLDLGALASLVRDRVGDIQ